MGEIDQCVLGVLGRSTNSLGDMSIISTAVNDRVLGRRANTVTWAQVATNEIANDAIDSQHYADGSIDLAHMSANSVDSDQYVDGSIDQEHLASGASKFIKRLGDNAADWSLAGTTEYTPTAVTMQGGAMKWTGVAAASGDVSAVYPDAFSNDPILLVSFIADNELDGVVTFYVFNDSETGFSLHWVKSGGSNPIEIIFNWLAIGPG